MTNRRLEARHGWDGKEDKEGTRRGGEGGGEEGARGKSARRKLDREGEDKVLEREGEQGLLCITYFGRQINVPITWQELEPNNKKTWWC
ncbi:hypothetical protein RHMOL_Rhmol13G0121600 [Rhododendron molle]|uniref:Uncharacterized protein n=1 Tax=Rhododendron molle TaxID=49168 RepID=A0ACC0L5T2_RHOML|nr:hypothetical protein RHMOL_Rhmol13G0121600 [Rhododendron molle]